MDRQTKRDIAMMLKLTPILLLLSWLMMKLISGIPIFIESAQEKVIERVSTVVKEEASNLKESYSKD